MSAVDLMWARVWDPDVEAFATELDRASHEDERALMAAVEAYDGPLPPVPELLTTLVMLMSRFGVVAMLMNARAVRDGNDELCAALGEFLYQDAVVVERLFPRVMALAHRRPV